MGEGDARQRDQTVRRPLGRRMLGGFEKQAGLYRGYLRSRTDGSDVEGEEEGVIKDDSLCLLGCW